MRTRLYRGGGGWLFGVSDRGMAPAEVMCEQGPQEVRVPAVRTPGRELLSERP